MQIKELRNKLAHEMSITLPLSARHVYKIGEVVCEFFELMTCPVPASFHELFWKLRLQALNLLNKEELNRLKLHTELGGST
jgi:hypothetical protein